MLLFFFWLIFLWFLRVSFYECIWTKMLQKTYYDAWNNIYFVCAIRIWMVRLQVLRVDNCVFMIFFFVYFSIRAIQMCTNMFKALVFTHRLRTMTIYLDFQDYFRFIIFNQQKCYQLICLELRDNWFLKLNY